MPTDWRKTDERLIRRGELILELGFVENYQTELDTMNHGKEGRPYKLTPTYIQFLTAFRILYGVPYRQLEGFTRSLHKLIPQLPPGDYSGLRKRSLALDPNPYQALKETDEPITIAVDSTGVKVRLAGGWVERKHGKKKRYVKLHFAVDVETKEIVAMEVSTDDVHDVKAFPGLLKKAEDKQLTFIADDGYLTHLFMDVYSHILHGCHLRVACGRHALMGSRGTSRVAARIRPSLVEGLIRTKHMKGLSHPGAPSSLPQKMFLIHVW